MVFISDLHIHSKFSRATSGDMIPENLWKWAQLKGIKVIGTGDFTHPGWLKEIKEKLEYQGNGLYALKKEYRSDDIPLSCKNEVYFLLTAEISCIFKRQNRAKKVHLVILAPEFVDVENINSYLSRIGNLSADGRPILGIDPKEVLKIVKDISPFSIIIPAHAWTPHFSIFGAESGFDSLEECFGELSREIFAIETGLSSDPSMNWRLSSLDRLVLLSNSDAHSPLKIGREANIFDTELSYRGIVNSIITKKGFIGTIEFFPQEGKYHYDGHRVCKVRLSPAETIKQKYICPVCGKKVTIGVMHRIERLSDRKPGIRPVDAPVFYSLIPLSEIIAQVRNTGINTKAVDNEYKNLINAIGCEFDVLMNCPIEEIEKVGSRYLAEAIMKVRKGDVHIEPGYDGKYGKIKIIEDSKEESQMTQIGLF